MTEPNELLIRSAVAGDFESIAQIYNYYIARTVVTFEVESVTADQMLQRRGQVQSDSLPWLVAELSGDVVGYAYASPWHARYAYRFSAETTVYLDHRHGGEGIGSSLYEVLLAELISKGMHTAIGGIAIPNDASVALHEKFGYSKSAHYKEVGFKFGQWIDVGYWQKMLVGDA